VPDAPAILEVRPLSPVLGAEIRGIDLSVELDPATIGELRSLWERYAVLLFRGATLGIPEQRRFVRYFGDVQDSRSPAERKYPEVMYVANVSVDGQAGEIPNGDMHFHNDHACYDRPTKGTTLYALEIPAVGGNTLFASTAGAYAAVPADLRSTLEGLDVLFVHDYINHGNHRGAPIWADAPRHAHPLVIAHPATGQPLLFCNRLMAHSIVGYEQAESDALIEQLCGYLERPQNVYEHVWRVNDLLIWDNLATAHARTDFDPAERRALRRIAIKGTTPSAYR